MIRFCFQYAGFPGKGAFRKERKHPCRGLTEGLSSASSCEGSEETPTLFKRPLVDSARKNGIWEHPLKDVPLSREVGWQIPIRKILFLFCPSVLYDFRKKRGIPLQDRRGVGLCCTCQACNNLLPLLFDYF